MIRAPPPKRLAPATCMSRQLPLLHVCKPAGTGYFLTATVPNVTFSLLCEMLRSFSHTPIKLPSQTTTPLARYSLILATARMQLAGAAASPCAHEFGRTDVSSIKLHRPLGAACGHSPLSLDELYPLLPQTCRLDASMSRYCSIAASTNVSTTPHLRTALVLLPVDRADLPELNDALCVTIRPADDPPEHI